MNDLYILMALYFIAGMLVGFIIAQFSIKKMGEAELQIVDEVSHQETDILNMTPEQKVDFVTELDKRLTGTDKK